jgi:hypothetical protein
MTGPEAVARVGTALAAAVPLWHGPGARVAALSGPHAHPWSFQFDLTADTPSGRRHLVVKIPRWEEAATLEAALAAGPQEGNRQEHVALKALAAAVAASGDPGLAAVLPVAYLPEINGVVTERLEAAPLRLRLGRWPGSERRQTEVLGRAGRALRLYHDRVAGAVAGALDGDTLAAELEAEAARLGGLRSGWPAALASLARRARERHGHPALLGAAHGDFNLANVLVTGDGRVAILDPNLVRGPLLADAAKLLTDLRMRRSRALTFGLLGRRGLAEAEAAFLEGYGPADLSLLGFLRAVATVRRGLEMEERLPARPAALRRLAGSALRRYPVAESSRWGA